MKKPGQTIIAGMGELHLEIIRERLFREFKVEATAGKPQIAYRENPSPPSPRAVGKFVTASPVVAVSMATRKSSLSRSRKGKGYEFSNENRGRCYPLRSTSSRPKKASRGGQQLGYRPLPGGGFQGAA